MKPSADMFLALADPTRREILDLLARDTHTINALADNFSISRPAVSKHIKVLSEAGFIFIRDVGRERHCMLKQEGFQDLRDWIDHFDAFWKTKLKRLEALMANTSLPGPVPGQKSSARQSPPHGGTPSARSESGKYPRKNPRRSR